jgi:hypothetical protein
MPVVATPRNQQEYAIGPTIPYLPPRIELLYTDLAIIQLMKLVEVIMEYAYHQFFFSSSVHSGEIGRKKVIGVTSPTAATVHTRPYVAT